MNNVSILIPNVNRESFGMSCKALCHALYVSPSVFTTDKSVVDMYMNEFDQYVQHFLKPERYIRYADDFVFLSEDKAYLEGLIPTIAASLQNLLALSLHPDKVYIRSLASGLDFLGWIHFKDHRVLRPATERRMRKRIIEHPKPETLQSYIGLLRHGNTKRLEQVIVNDYLLHEKLVCSASSTLGVFTV